ncbi:PH domain-containing protein [Georgenia yuyongxinii]|uniref:PH domain-containing protein n=2 Tax=Georgenia yuyongxinii TaxID=2589797 RepID=A0A552WPY7_9MICO|nr:PH domain-containing protein [Georgenia yuyongxinii]
MVDVGDDGDVSQIGAHRHTQSSFHGEGGPSAHGRATHPSLPARAGRHVPRRQTAILRRIADSGHPCLDGCARSHVRGRGGAFGEDDPMGPTVVFRPDSSRVYAVICWVVAAGVLVAFAVNGGIGELVRYGALPLAVAAFGWAVFWQPFVEVGPDGVTLANVMRTVVVPWGAIDAVDTHWGVRLRTAAGAFGAWAAPARAGFGRSRSRREAENLPDRLFRGNGTVSASGDAAAVGSVIEDRLGRRDRLARTGARGTGPTPRARVNIPEVLALGVTVALAVVSLVAPV